MGGIVPKILNWFKAGKQRAATNKPRTLVTQTGPGEWYMNQSWDLDAKEDGKETAERPSEQASGEQRG
jgi:hypothetical protein